MLLWSVADNAICALFEVERGVEQGIYHNIVCVCMDVTSCVGLGVSTSSVGRQGMAMALWAQVKSEHATRPVSITSTCSNVRCGND